MSRFRRAEGRGGWRRRGDRAAAAGPPTTPTSEAQPQQRLSEEQYQSLVSELRQVIDTQRRTIEQLRRRVDQLDPPAPAPSPAAEQTAGENETVPARHPTGRGSPRSELAVRLLGPFEVELAGRPVGSWRSHKAALLLQYLLLQTGRRARREALIEAIWPASGAKSGRNNLNVAVYQLREMFRAIDPERAVIVYQQGAYRFDPGLMVWCDVDEFLRAVRDGRVAHDSGATREALDVLGRADVLYRGRLLDGDLSCEWFHPLQDRFHQEHCDVLERIGSILLGQGEAGEAVAVGERLLTEDPCRETGHQLLMRAYAARNQPHLVVRQFQRCVALLRRELAVSPAQATIDLIGQLVPDL